MSRNKKIGFIGFLLSSFFINLSAVFAQDDIVSEWLRFIFVDLGDLAESGDQIFIIYSKILLFFLVFAIIFWSSEKVFHEKAKIAGVIAFIISLMGVVLLPGEVILTIFQTYSVIIGYGFILLPVIVGLVLAHKFGGKGGETWKKALKGIIFIIISIVTFYVSAAMVAEGSDIYVGVAQWVKVGGIIALIVGIFYLLTCWGWESQSTAPPTK